MKHLFTFLSILCLAFTLSAQLTDWKSKTSFRVTERSGAALANHQVMIIANTDSLIGAGLMNSDASDVRFALDCDGNDQLSYYLENNPATGDGIFWVMLERLEADSTIPIFMFYNNPAATAVSDFAVVFPNALIVEADEELSVTEWNFDWIEIKSGVTVNLPVTLANDLPLAPVPFTMNARRIKIDGNFVGDFAGHAGGKADGDGLGDGGGETTGAGPYIFNLGAGGGGAYGGDGGAGGFTNSNTNYSGPGGKAHGDAKSYAIKPGSGGGSACTACATVNSGGNGGGAVFMEATYISISGSMRFTGEYMEPNEPIFMAGAGGGSGGGFLASSILLKKSGDVTCNGANGSTGTGSGGGGGSGGRIKLFHELPFSNAGKLEVKAGQGAGGDTQEQTGIDGAPGTVFDSVLVSTEPLVVEVPLAAKMSLTSSIGTTVCEQEPFKLKAAPDGLDLYNYSLNGINLIKFDSDSLSAGADFTGMYWAVTGEIGGCVIPGDTLFFTVKEKVEPNFSFTASDLDYQFQNSSLQADTYNWDFGDGSSSVQDNPIHSFPGTGTYEVCLEAQHSDAICPADTLCKDVVVTCALPNQGLLVTGENFDYSFTDTTANSSLRLWRIDGADFSSDSIIQVTFADTGVHEICLINTNICGVDTFCTSINAQCKTPFASFSFSGSFLDYTFVDTTAGGSSRNWSIDGKALSSDSIFNFKFAAEGVYQVCLESSGFCGVETHCEMVTIICSKPNPGFTQQASELDYQFTDTSATALSRQWTVNGAVVSTEANFNYSFPEAGDYEVCLFLVNECGGEVYCENIQVNCDALVSDFSYTQQDSAFNFSSLATGIISAWFWDFGDGNTSTLENPDYNYESPGVYDVCLTITNVCDETDSYCEEVTVEATTSINEQEMLSFSLYPNPSTGRVVIQLASELTDFEVSVLNTLGQEMALKITKVSGGYALDLGDVSEGLYFVRLQSGINSSVERLLIKR